MDYYKILGVEKTATQDEIKKKYRQLAMKTHPDRGGNANTLVKINEAYEVLKDPQKRKHYDATASGAFNSQFNMNDIFNNRNTRQQYRNTEIVLNVKMTLEQVMIGKTVGAKYPLHSGKVEDIDINIPAGVHHNQVITYYGLGDDAIPGQRGNLLIKIFVLPNTEWTRYQNNLIKEIPINVLDLITGCSIMFKTIDGKTLDLKINPGTQHGGVYSIAEYGIPDLMTSKKGDVIIKVVSTVPKITDTDLINQTQELKDAISKKS
jgi:DnaJ-class molecular chaperone